MADEVIVRDRLFDLRDYFAGQALCGLVLREGPHSVWGVAEVAYEYADAMIEAREQSRKSSVGTGNDTGTPRRVEDGGTGTGRRPKQVQVGQRARARQGRQ